MGYPSHKHPHIPEVQEAVARILAAAKAAGKYAGMVRPIMYFTITIRQHST
jgi:2-keto-3-deoxy-L-rhamnonate aldolase RhmA